MLVSRFVGDVDTVENLFTFGIISMFADVCKIISILVVIWYQNRGLTLVLLMLLPILFVFTRQVQKNMLTAQIENRKAVGRASGHVPETLHNIRTIHCLAKERYMEERYDQYIGQDRRQRCKEFVLTAKHVSEDRSKQSGKTTENNIRDDASA